MNAIVIGRAGLAIVLDGDQLFTIDAAAPDRMSARGAHELHLLLANARGARLMEDTNLAEVRGALEEDTRSEQALQLALIILDPAHADVVRVRSALALDALLQTPRVQRRLEGVLYAREIPPDLDLGSARALLRREVVGTVEACMRRLGERQPFIAQVSTAWKQIADPTFGHADGRQRALEVLVRECICAELVNAQASGRTLEPEVIFALGGPALQAIPYHGAIVAAWLAGVRASPTQRLELKGEKPRVRLVESALRSALKLQRQRPDRAAPVLALRAEPTRRSQPFLEDVYTTYSQPLFAYALLLTRDTESAKDLVQDVFVRLASGSLQPYSDRIRLRSWLLSLVRNEYRAQRPLMTRAPHLYEPSHVTEAPTPEELYDRRWAQLLFERVLLALEREQADPRFQAAVRSALLGEPLQHKELSLDPTPLRVLRARLRRRFATLLREQVAQTLTHHDDLETELHTLLHSIRNAPDES